MKTFAKAVPVVLLLGACGGADEPVATPTVTVTETASPVQESPTMSASPTMPATPTPPPTTELSIERAIRQAVRVAPGKPVEGGRDREQGQPVWFIVVRQQDGSGAEVYINRSTGELVGQQVEGLSPVAQSAAPGLSAQRAIRRAENVSGGTAIEFELERLRGVTVWHVVTKGSAGTLELDLNADSGAVVRQQRD